MDSLGRSSGRRVLGVRAVSLLRAKGSFDFPWDHSSAHIGRRVHSSSGGLTPARLVVGVLICGRVCLLGRG